MVVRADLDERGGCVHKCHTMLCNPFKYNAYTNGRYRALLRLLRLPVLLLDLGSYNRFQHYMCANSTINCAKEQLAARHDPSRRFGLRHW